MQEDSKLIFCFIAIVLFIISVIGIIGIIKNGNKKTINYTPMALIMSLFFFLWSIILFFTAYYTNIDIIGFVFLCSIGVMLLIDNIYQIVLLKICTVKISAKYLYSDHIHKSFKEQPVFSYKFEGETYTIKSQQSAFPKYIKKNFKADTSCEIFIHPNNPAINIMRKKITVLNILNILANIFIFALAIFFYFFAHQNI